MSRHRSKQSDPILTPFSGKWRQTNSSGTVWNSWAPAAGGDGSWYDVDTQEMTDQVNPGYFRAMRENKVLPFAPMSSTKVSTIRTPGFSDLRVKSATSAKMVEVAISGHFTVDHAALPDPGFPAVNDDLALQEAYDRAQHDAWDALTFVAEFRSTLELFHGARERYMRLYTTFADKVFSKTRQLKGVAASVAISEIWLEMRYAWRPLLYDLQDINRALERLASGVETPLQRAYGTRSSERSVSAVGSGAFRGPLGSGLTAGFIPVYARVSSATTVAHASVGLKVKATAVYSADPLVTAWELVPFSFIMDWFVSIGAALSAFSPFAGGNLLYSGVALSQTSEVTETYSLQVATPSWVLVSGSSVPSIRTVKTEHYQRYAKQPTPTVGIDINLDMFKLLDLLALILTFNQKTLRKIFRHI